VTRTMWLSKMRNVAMVLMSIAFIALGGEALFHRLTAAEWMPSAPQVTRNGPEARALKAVVGQQTNDDNSPEVAAANERRFKTSCEVHEIGKNGELEAISRPHFVTSDGQPGKFIIGQYHLIPGKAIDSNDSVDFGLLASLTVTSRMDGQLVFDVTLEILRGDRLEEGFVVVSGHKMRCVKVVNASETVEIEFGKDIAGQCRYRASFTVCDFTKKDR
jgi:hypothetical protein